MFKLLGVQGLDFGLRQARIRRATLVIEQRQDRFNRNTVLGWNGRGFGSMTEVSKAQTCELCVHCFGVCACVFTRRFS